MTEKESYQKGFLNFQKIFHRIFFWPFSYMGRVSRPQKASSKLSTPRPMCHPFLTPPLKTPVFWALDIGVGPKKTPLGFSKGKFLEKSLGANSPNPFFLLRPFILR